MNGTPNLLLGEAERIHAPESIDVRGGDIVRLSSEPWLWIVYRGVGRPIAGSEEPDGSRSFAELELVRMHEFGERVIVPFGDIVEVVYPSSSSPFAQQQHDALLEFDEMRGAV